MATFPSAGNQIGRSPIRGYWIFEDGHCEAIDSIAAVEKRGDPARRFIWIDMKGPPNEALQKWMEETFGWHPTVLHHFKIRSSRPRIDDYEGYTHVTLHALRSGFVASDRRLTLELDVVLGNDYLVTVHQSSTPPDVDEVFQNLPKKLDFLRSPDLLLHRIVATMIDRYTPVVDAIDGKLTKLEQDALYKAQPTLLETIVLARDEVLGLKHVLVPQVQILQELSEYTFAGVKPDNRAYFRNSEQRLRHLLDDIAVYQEIARNAFELYQASITYRTNETMRVLTVISVPLMVIAFITGLYGMNVPIPLAEHAHAFSTIVALSAAVFIGMMIYFRKRKWF